MAGPIATLRVLLTGDDAELRKKLKSSDKATRDWAKKQQQYVKSVRIGFAAMGAAVAATAVAYAKLTKEAVKYADNLAKTADKIGLSVEGLQELRYAADRAGVDVRKADMGFQRFARRLGEAQQGMGELSGTLKDLGIQLRNSDGSLRSTEAVLNDYAEAVKNAETPQERLRLAFKAFDSEGAAMVNMLKNGAAGLDEMRDAARELGLIMSEETTRKAEVMQDTLNGVGSVLKTQLNTALVESAHEHFPAFVKALDTMESVFYRIIEATNLVSAGAKIVSRGFLLAGGHAVKFGRHLGDALVPSLEKLDLRMKVYGAKLRLGINQVIASAANAADLAFQNAPQFIKDFFGYSDGQFGAAKSAVVDKIKRDLAEAEANLDAFSGRQKSKPSALELALFGTADEMEATIDSSLQKALDARNRIEEIATDGGVASSVFSTVSPESSGSGDGSEDNKPKEVAYHEKVAQMILDNEKIFQGKMADLRASATSQGLAQLGQYVKGHTVAGRAILFAQKAMAVKQILISGQVAIMKAFESGPIMGAIQAAMVAGQLSQALSTTKSVSVQGQFHDGIDNVPSTGTYLLEKGERVVDRRLNEDLTKALAEGGSGVGGGSNTLSINVNGVSDAETINRVISEQRPQFEQMLRDINSDNAGQGLI